MSPESSYRCAGEDTRKDCPDGVGDDNGHREPVRELELLGREDASILEEHGSFCQTER